MRQPAKIKPWLSEQELQTWVRHAPTKALYQRRLVIWLASRNIHYAHEISVMVQASVRSVHRWIAEYNEQGPSAFEQERRGGRQWQYLTPEQERRLMSKLSKRAERGQVLTAQQIRDPIEQAVGHEVSMSYVYQLLDRHDWRKVVPRPRHKRADLIEQMAYKS